MRYLYKQQKTMLSCLLLYNFRFFFVFAISIFFFAQKNAYKRQILFFLSFFGAHLNISPLCHRPFHPWCFHCLSLIAAEDNAQTTNPRRITSKLDTSQWINTPNAQNFSWLKQVEMEFDCLLRMGPHTFWLELRFDFKICLQKRKS